MKKTMNYKIIIVSLFYVLLTSQYSPSQSQHRSVTIIIEALPGNTPAEDTIFACGNFNNWNVKDTTYQVRRRFDGKLFVTIPQNRDTIEFKFSRGNWMKIETDSMNSYLPNRQLSGKFKSPVSVKIENWQDIGGQTSLPLYVLILSAALLNGIFLIIILKSTRKNYSVQRTSQTIIWTVFLIIVFTGAVIYEFTDLIWKFRLMLSFEILLFMGGPFLQRLYKAFFVPQRHLPIYHFVPALIAMMINIPRFLNIWQFKWVQTPLRNDLFIIDAVLIISGSFLFLLYAISLVIKLYHKKRRLKKEDNPVFVSSRHVPPVISTHKGRQGYSGKGASEWLLFMIVSTINFFAVVSGIYLFLLNASGTSFIPDHQDIALSVSSLQLFVIFYFVYFNEIVFMPQKKTEREGCHNEQLANSIMEFMHQSKPYLDADITLNVFAEMMGEKPHVISKAINDCFNKNFRDFINEFRVNEFIDKMNTDKAKNLTFLYLAHEVGFNSKSTFNLAFKKATGLSPREYFHTKTQNT
jgi:AraC-like DNA-binding protein